MRPTLFTIFDIPFHSYNVLMAGAFLTAVWLWFRENDRREKPFNVTPMGALWLFVGVLVGSKVFWILQYDSPWRLYRAVYVWEGGLVFYGGLIGGVVAALGYLAHRRVNPVALGDTTMPYIPVFHGIGRIGCFLNGCCWGYPTDMPWGVRFPERSLPHLDQVKRGLVSVGDAPLPVHPTQLYEVFALFAIGAALFALRRRPRPPGFLMVLYPLLYGVWRFTNEFFRADVPRHALDFTLSQWVSLGIAGTSLLVGTILTFTVWRRWQPPAAPEPAKPPENTDAMGESS